MDEVTRYNLARWKALAEADALYTRPALNLDPASARELVDPEGLLGSVAGKDVLCLASGGGKQSAAFAMLGARVTVFDLSEDQLRRDREAAAHYGFDVRTHQGDMRDLSRFGEASFDIVSHAYSLSFVPDARAVFRQVARVVRPGGVYYFHCANPFYSGLSERDWNGEGYTLKETYADGAQVTYEDQEWVYERGVARPPVPPPREYRHALSTLVGGLAGLGFVLFHVSDISGFDPDPEAEPGTWDHFVSVAPPWLGFWAAYRPDVLPPAAAGLGDRPARAC